MNLESRFKSQHFIGLIFSLHFRHYSLTDSLFTARRYASAVLLSSCVCLSVRPSVRLSVRRGEVNGRKKTGMPTEMLLDWLMKK